ncbi:MAG: VTT domain-containing protein [Verrucomicrobiales bacterium]|nr:VTT domain-containing protein [Verrucomicrobiales bacterium]
MDLIRQALDFVLHLSDRLDGLAAEYRSGIYMLLFVIVFCETGLVITPFLPGDSLLFAVGAVAARDGSPINIWVVAAVLFAAAFAGDNVNYWVGRLAGRELVRRFPRLIQQKHLDRTHAFFEKYGRKTIVLARFVPIVRTFTPFVAGMGAMDFPRFLAASVFATTLWVGLILPAGWFFGNFEPVKKHFELVVIGIIVVSCIPMAVEFLKARRENRG